MVKKTVILLAVLIALFLFITYVLIPGTITVSRSAFIKANPDAVFRKLRHTDTWKEWWPGGFAVNESGKKVFTWNEKNKFVVIGEFINAFRIGASFNGDSSESVLSFLPGTYDSMEVRWQTSFITDKNPVTRIREYFFSKRIAKGFDAILEKLAPYISEVKNIYGFPFKEETVPFQFLIATKQEYDHEPSMTEIYAMIDKLKMYTAKNNGKETGAPLLYTWAGDSTRFNAQVAVPVDKPLPQTETFSIKWMLKGGNIIAADVTGGNYTINRAMKEIDLYVGDHKRSRVAIPFQQLITNRLTEPDTTRWITKVYYPVI